MPGSQTIEGVPTSTAAFLGETEKGSLTPRLVTSYAEYRRWFGGVFAPKKYLPHTISGFFENGGKRAHVCRILGEDYEEGLAALEDESCREVSLVYAPNASAEIAKAVIAHCEKTRYRFAVIDCEEGQSNASQLNPRGSIGDSSYGAFYYPWIFAAEPGTGTRTLTPPGGHVLGMYARTDNERGVFKAPANEVVRGALGVEFNITDPIQDVLNPQGVNVIRSFPARGVRVWGSRTLGTGNEWKYVNIRRLIIYLEHSIEAGMQWAAFEPNDSRLWARVVGQIANFLRMQWRAGALQGRTEQEAFFVKCDLTTMSQDDILNGRLTCEVGVAPVKPAEFVIFRICQRTASP